MAAWRISCHAPNSEFSATNLLHSSVSKALILSSVGVSSGKRLLADNISSIVANFVWQLMNWGGNRSPNCFTDSIASLALSSRLYGSLFHWNGMADSFRLVHLSSLYHGSCPSGKKENRRCGLYEIPAHFANRNSSV